MVKKSASDITSWHRPAGATAPLRTGADKCKAGSGAGKHSRAKQTRSVGGATTHGRRTRQAGESVPI